MKYSFSDIIIFTGITLGILAFAFGIFMMGKFFYEAYKFFSNISV